jgi:hypothetical protein
MNLQQCYYCRNLKPHNDLRNVQLSPDPLKTALQSIVFSQFVKTSLNQQGKALLQKTVTAQTTTKSLPVTEPAGSLPYSQNSSTLHANADLLCY